MAAGTLDTFDSESHWTSIGQVLIGGVSFDAGSSLLTVIVPISDELFLCGDHITKVGAWACI